MHACFIYFKLGVFIIIVNALGCDSIIADVALCMLRVFLHCIYFFRLRFLFSSFARRDPRQAVAAVHGGGALRGVAGDSGATLIDLH